jgi:hypothetical protein
MGNTERLGSYKVYNMASSESIPFNSLSCSTVQMDGVPEYLKATLDNIG